MKEQEQKVRKMIKEEIQKISEDFKGGLSDKEIRSLQFKIKRVLNKELSKKFRKGTRYKADPTIVRGMGGKTKRRQTYSGEYEIDTIKDAWNSVSIDFFSPQMKRFDRNQQLELIEELETSLNKKFSFSRNVKWFEIHIRSGSQLRKNFTITRDRISQIFGNKPEDPKFK